MAIGPLEYIVLALDRNQFAHEVLPELAAIQAQGAIRVVDLVFIAKDDSGAVTVQEVDQLAGDIAPAYGSLADDLGGLLTPEDLNRLAEPVPPGVSAVVVLFEHLWTHALRSAIDRAGGQVLGGGMAEPAALQRLETELATQAGVP